MASTWTYRETFALNTNQNIQFTLKIFVNMLWALEIYFST